MKIDKARLAHDYTQTCKTVEQIAAEHGVSTHAIRKARRDMGIPPRHMRVAKPPAPKPIKAVDREDVPARNVNARACDALLAKLRHHHPLPARAARDVPVGASWAFTEHRTCAEVV